MIWHLWSRKSEITCMSPPPPPQPGRHNYLPFTLELFIDQLKFVDEFETSDLDLDLQGKICHESFKCLCNSL